MKGGRQPGLLCRLATFDLFFGWFPNFHDEPFVLTDVAIQSRKYYPDWDTKLQCGPEPSDRKRPWLYYHTDEVSCIPLSIDRVPEAVNPRWREPAREIPPPHLIDQVLIPLMAERYHVGEVGEPVYEHVSGYVQANSMP